MTTASPFLTRYVYEARLVDLYDGDTLRLAVDLGFHTVVTETFRLLGVQAPELSGPGVTPAEREAGLAARSWLLQHLEGRPLTIQTVKDRREGRGRYLAALFLMGFNVAEVMVAAGHAYPYDGKGKAPKWTGPGVWAAP